VQTASLLQSGEIFSLEGLGGAVGVVADVAEFVLDPIASLASSAAGFLLDYVGPLRDMLDSIAGDPGAVEAKAVTWANISSRVVDSADDLDVQVRRALSSWTGPAASAYAVFADVLGQSLRALSDVCSGVGAGMQGASAVVGFVRAIVRDVIADLVGKLISWASQVAVTAGVGATWVVPNAIRAIAVYVERVRGWLDKLTRAIRSTMKALDDVNTSLTRSVPALRRVADVLDSVPLGATITGTETPTLRVVIDSAASLSGTANKTIDALDDARGRSE
jgi:uncharacterized protein YukE